MAKKRRVSRRSKATKNMKMCGRCMDWVNKLYPAPCSCDPTTPPECRLGMFHCPDCGAMLMGHVPHPELCGLCRDKKHPQFDNVKRKKETNDSTEN